MYNHPEPAFGRALMTSTFRNEHYTQSEPFRMGTLLPSGMFILFILTVVQVFVGTISAAENRRLCFVPPSDQLGQRVYATNPHFHSKA